QRTEDDLSHFVSASGELVEHQMLARNGCLVAIRGLLDVVERAGNQRVIRDAPPVEVGIDDAGAARGSLFGCCGGSHVRKNRANVILRSESDEGSCRGG